MKYERGDLVQLKSDADVSLSYKEGSPPRSFIKNALWMVDAVEELDDDMQSLNLSTFEPLGSINAGSYCSWTSNEDVLKKVEVQQVKKKITESSDETLTPKDEERRDDTPNSTLTEETLTSRNFIVTPTGIDFLETISKLVDAPDFQLNEPFTDTYLDDFTIDRGDILRKLLSIGVIKPWKEKV